MDGDGDVYITHLHVAECAERLLPSLLCQIVLIHL